MSETIDTVRVEAPAAGTTAGPVAPAPGAAPAIKVRRTVFAGYTAGQLLLGAAVIALLVWGMWVTRALTGEPPQRIVKADLSKIVGDYVQAQARSATPPNDVQAQMQQFMASLDTELQRRGAKGEVVLVGEAVLTKSVPDITPDVVNAVYASGVKRPQPATAAQMGQMLRSAPAPGGQAVQVPVAPVAAPVQAPAGESPFGPAPTPDASVAPAQAGATVSSFGGLDGAGGQ